MILTWGPLNRVPVPYQQLFIRTSNGNEVHHFDPRLKCVNPGQDPYIDRFTGEIDHRQTLSLECFETEMINGVATPRNIAQIRMLEQVLFGI